MEVDGVCKVALMVGSLRMLGFVPAVLEADEDLVDYVIAGVALGARGGLADEVSGRSRRERVAAVLQHAGWRKANRSDLKSLDARVMQLDVTDHDSILVHRTRSLPLDRELARQER